MGDLEEERAKQLKINYPSNYLILTYASLIYDENVIKNFYEKVLGNISDYELNFVSVAARNKYLTPEEKENTRLGHTCMLGKTIIKEDNAIRYLNKVRQLDASSTFYRDFNDNQIPRHCMVVYANVNPTSVSKATYEFKKVLADYEKEAFQLAEVGDPSRFENLLNRYKNLHNNLMTCYQTQRSRKRWIDIDCDVDENVDVEEMFKYIKDFCKESKKFEDVTPIGVITQGGLHILINTNGLKDSPQKIVDEAIRFVSLNKGSYKEILINKNEMLPLPGTMQNGKEVIMLE